MEQELLIIIEEAALNAWPAPRQMLYDGWLLRFTGGHSKRVNSVNPLYPARLALEEKIRTCEAIYASQGLPCLFRINEFIATPQLTQALQAAGYTSFDPTYVLGRDLVLGKDVQADLTILEMPADDWFRMRDQFIRVPAADRLAHEAVLHSIVPEMVLMGLFARGKPVACGMGVVEGSLMGFFSIYTASIWRRKGYGRLIMEALSDWGIERGATYGYLQVEGDNHPALAMYERLGFERIYAYGYYRKQVVGSR
jgi:GNAT superfamily N-acetyltransferase